MSGPSISVTGREPEIGAIHRFLDHLADGPGALVIEGSAGIGKTTLWSAGVSEARDRGHQVLMARAAEPEARHSYAALGDLPGGLGADLPSADRPPRGRHRARCDVQGQVSLIA